MDYNNKTLYETQYSFDPRDDGIKAKYPRVWQGANQVNVVLWGSSDFGGYIHSCRGQEDESSRFRDDGFNNSDRVGFLLDMNNGTLALYRNGNHVGEIASGLVGEYVWVARLGSSLRNEDASVRICEWD